MDEIELLRKKVDEIDEQIIFALSERAKICKSIGLVKKKQGKPVRDVSREVKVFKRVQKKAIQFHLNPVQVESVYREIVNMCSAVQE
jgi:chorismate mutase